MSKNYFVDIQNPINELLELRKSDLYLAYLTGDKQPAKLFATHIHPEIIPILYDHLSLYGKKKKITLFLYSAGGILEAPWGIVNLIREFCNDFEVVIPYRALSAATLLSLGANKIIMTPLSLLSPIDPTGNFNINNEKKAIQVEDIFGFVDFAKTKVGLVEQASLSEVLNRLVGEVPPSVLGSTNRTQSLIRRIATKMLQLNKDSFNETEITQIVEDLTQKLFSHNHVISRREAKKEIGLKSVVYASKEEEKIINSIFDFYKKKLLLDERFDPESLIGKEQQATVTYDRAIVSSQKIRHVFRSKLIVKQTQPGQLNLNMKELGWKKESEESEKKNQVKTMKRKDKK